MAFDFKTAVPWGRSLREYMAMFDLTCRDMESRLLDCGGGPASFNAELTSRGGRVFPLLDLHGEKSVFLGPVLSELSTDGMRPRVVEVEYEFQRGGNQMLVVDRVDRR